MKKRQPPKKPKNISKRYVNNRIIESALIMRMSFSQIEMIKSMPFKSPAEKALKVASQILETANAIQNIFSKKTKYLERINKNR